MKKQKKRLDWFRNKALLKQQVVSVDFADLLLINLNDDFIFCCFSLRSTKNIANRFAKCTRKRIDLRRQTSLSQVARRYKFISVF